MRRIYLTGLCLAVLGVLSAVAPATAQEKDQAKTKDLIVGKWTLVKSEQEIKGTLEFTKDGKVKISFTPPEGEAVSVEGTYKVTAEDKIEVELESMEKKQTESLTVKVTKEELTTTDSRGQTVTFKRVSK